MARKVYKSTEEVKRELLAHKNELINQLKEENFHVFVFLHEQLCSNEPITENRVYRFVYRSYYNLENFGVTSEFEQVYFQLMEQERKMKNAPKIVELTYTLYKVKNRNNNPSMQFPLVVHLLHTINPYFPTFEAKVATFFSFSSTYHLTRFKKKMKRYIEQYRYLYQTYQQLLKDPEIKQLISQIEENIEDSSFKSFPAIKKLDVIINRLAHL